MSTEWRRWYRGGTAFLDDLQLTVWYIEMDYGFNDAGAGI